MIDNIAHENINRISIQHLEIALLRDHFENYAQRIDLSYVFDKCNKRT